MNTQAQTFKHVRNKLTHSSILFLKLFENIKFGDATIVLPNDETYRFKGSVSGQSMQINIHDWKFCEELFIKGDIGLGESYIKKMWTTPNIAHVIEFGLMNYEALSDVIRGSIYKILYYRFKHFLNRNTKKGSSKNIHAHYDIGNDFYKLWLDKTMTYSSAFFNEKEYTLEEAQRNKYENILTELGAKEGDHILEIGCGWGGFIEYAHTKGIKVTGVTISQEQFNYVQNNLAQNKENLSSVILRDYRDLNGQYDHIVSIEMFEALGEAYWKKYFDKVANLLKKNGKALIQTITMNHASFKSYKNGSDFIQQYIFPGGMLPSPEVFCKKALKAKLKTVGSTEFGQDYARTLYMWEKNFQKQIGKIKEQGFDDNFIRTWEFYLKYCEGAFKAARLSVFQFLLAKS